MPMKFNPYTGHERHPADIEIDPEGVLIIDPDKPVYAARSTADAVAQALVRKARVLDHYINPQRRGEAFVVRDTETGSLLAYAQPGNAAELLASIVRGVAVPMHAPADDICYQGRSGYDAAWYEIADALGIPATPGSPKEVHESKIMPTIRTLVGMQKERTESLGAITPAVCTELPPAPEPVPDLWYEAVLHALKAEGVFPLPQSAEDPVPWLVTLLDKVVKDAGRPITPNAAANAWNALLRISQEVDPVRAQSIMGHVKVAMTAQYQSGLNKGKADASMTPILQLIADERAKQIAKGATVDSDINYDPTELAQAAVCYALPTYDAPGGIRTYDALEPQGWPWARKFWHPEGERRNLTKAAALLVARLEVLQEIDARSLTKGAK